MNVYVVSYLPATLGLSGQAWLVEAVFSDLRKAKRFAREEFGTHVGNSTVDGRWRGTLGGREVRIQRLRVDGGAS